MLGASLSFFSMGCWVSTPLTTPRPAVDSRVVITLTEAGTTVMAAQLGPGKVDLMGDVTALTDSALVLGLRSVTNRRGVEELWTGEQVTVPQSAIATVVARKVSVTRSVLLAAATLTGVVLVGALLTRGEGTTFTIEPPPTGQ